MENILKYLYVYIIVCEADLYILMLYVSQLVSVPWSKSN